uniref:Uncharacterized protein n=1 Tax=Rousettus aegyptiacus TaxID=9407 RepID=A0A7J8E8M6_ROUAE|nr:hypothetical protein HJG63_008076 [Rousettus aegyptiacus]
MVLKLVMTALTVKWLMTQEETGNGSRALPGAGCAQGPKRSSEPGCRGPACLVEAVSGGCPAPRKRHHWASGFVICLLPPETAAPGGKGVIPSAWSWALSLVRLSKHQRTHATPRHAGGGAGARTTDRRHPPFTRCRATPRAATGGHGEFLMWTEGPGGGPGLSVKINSPNTLDLIYLRFNTL